MLASIQKLDEGYLAEFERLLTQSVEEVWSMLTVNEKLVQWFPELEVKDLQAGGTVKFNMPDGSTIDMTITDFKMLSILEYTWGEDQVRFELHPQSDGTLLILKERINKVTNHTPKDLAGWHVCLDVIVAILDGRQVESRKQEWEKWYKKYVQAVENM